MLEREEICSACMERHKVVPYTRMEVGRNGKFFIAEYEYCKSTDTLIETEGLIRKNMKRYKADDLESKE